MKLTESSSLLDKFVNSFSVFDEMLTFDNLDTAKWALRKGKPPKSGGLVSWRPRKVKTPRWALEGLYEKLPARFPPLYEELILNYRWAEVELGRLRLLANPPGPGLDGLANQIFNDPCLVETLIQKGYNPVRKGVGYEL
jgi:hypothetical protein